MPEDTEIKTAHDIIDRTIRQRKRELRKSRSLLTALRRKVSRVDSLGKQIIACNEQRKMLEEQIQKETEK